MYSVLRFSRSPGGGFTVTAGGKPKVLPEAGQDLEGERRRPPAGG
jgi:hypothetical protein